MVESLRQFVLHEAILKRDFAAFKERVDTLSKHEVRHKLMETDHLGFTPATLAGKISYCDYSAMLPFLQCIMAVHKNVCLDLDKRGITLIDEAIYSKNNDLMALVFTHEKDRYFEQLTKRLKLTSQLLEQSGGDFAVDIHWEVYSSVVPLVSNVLPRDTIRIIKHKDMVRIDFSNLSSIVNPKTDQ